MSTSDPKSQLRTRLRATRAALSPTDARTRSAAVHANLFLQPEFWAAPILLTYVSIENEVDTRSLIHAALKEGRRIAVPRIWSQSTMDWVEIRSLDGLLPGRHGIPEPGQSEPALIPGSDSLVLVPGIAFSPSGHRIGFGGGYFDRFLTEFTGTSVGLAYDFQIVTSWPTAGHDQPVQLVVAESVVYRADVSAP